MSKVVGIDLGTTFSAVAHINEYGQPEIIPNTDSDRITASVVMFDEEDGVTKVIVGKDAKNQAVALSEQIAEFIKRDMGKPKEECPQSFNGTDYSPEELSAMILAKIKKDAEAYLNTEITDAVITVPAYFHDAEREATRNAGKIAGLNVLQILNEPTAAALAYGIDRLGTDQTVFVFDLGGGTFDVTVMRVSGSKIEMIATNGDPKLGGKDWDDRIITYIAEMHEIEHGENPLNDNDLSLYQDLQTKAIAAKESLSRLDRARIVCGYNGKTTRVELAREKFEELTSDLLERCRVLCDIVLSEASMTWIGMDTILLVGGSTRMPMIREMVGTISGKKINPHEVNPDEAVAIGAAIQATLHQISEGSTAAENMPDPVIDRFIGPDGAPKVTVIDGATHNLGIIVLNSQREKINDVMIPKMTAVPCEIANQYGTVADNQKTALIRVMQGLDQDQQEDEETKFDAYKLGECVLELPPGLPKGSPIEVIYKYNLDQTLEVTAKSISSNGPTAIYDVFSVIQRQTLNAEQVTEAAKTLQELEVE